MGLGAAHSLAAPVGKGAGSLILRGPVMKWSFISPAGFWYRHCHRSPGRVLNVSTIGMERRK